MLPSQQPKYMKYHRRNLPTWLSQIGESLDGEDIVDDINFPRVMY